MTERRALVVVIQKFNFISKLAKFEWREINQISCITLKST